MYKLKDIISSGGTNPKINKAIDRYELSKDEKKDIINSIKNNSSSTTTDEWEYFRVKNMSSPYAITEIGILFTILVPYVFDNLSFPMLIDTGTLMHTVNASKQTTVETILNNTKGNVIKVSKFNMPKKFGDMMAGNIGLSFESMDTFSEFIAIGGYDGDYTQITKEEYDKEINEIFSQYIG